MNIYVICTHVEVRKLYLCKGHAIHFLLYIIQMHRLEPIVSSVLIQSKLTQVSEYCYT